MSTTEVSGYITQIKGKYVVVKITELNLVKVVDISYIKFRGFPAHPSLIAVNSVLILKLIQNNIIEASIDTKIEINAYFGFIKEVDILTQKSILSNFFEMYECLATQIFYANNQSVPLSELKNKINYPVIVYLNGDSFLEARILQEDTIIKL
ncbi:hypothetical protein SteCoe_7076 [Stentor coeruleus]|uniref:Uncharacterized protein n=1 Tax=Stentor coeruleus TaxID=5963 RepID=A0A1R2CAZ5_9CILI|nr:hypothetical protein SteCoe_12431 [Stentor coeruleus]OMJ90579.1 hypothetical protein SteCoe_7076 [Stentor coeruleus]